MLHGHCQISFLAREELTNGTIESVFSFQLQYNSIVPVMDIQKPVNCTFGTCKIQFYSNKQYELNHSDRHITGNSTTLDMMIMRYKDGLYDYSWSITLHYRIVHVPYCDTEVVKPNTLQSEARKNCGQVITEKRANPFTFLMSHYVLSKVIFGLQKDTNCNGKARNLFCLFNYVMPNTLRMGIIGDLILTLYFACIDFRWLGCVYLRVCS